MSAALDAIEALAEALARALDADNADVIEAAGEALAACLDDLRAEPAEAPRLAALAASLGALQGRVNLLTDACRRRTEALAGLRGATPLPVYTARR